MSALNLEDGRLGRRIAYRVASLLHGLSWRGLLAVVAWGASFVATRIALQALDPFSLVAIRLLVGTALLSALLKVRRQRLLPLRRDVPTCLALGLTLSLHLLIQAYGLEHTSAINTGWIIGFIPVTIAIGAQLLGQQRLSALGWVGVATGSLGVLTVTAVAPPDFAHARFGDLLQVASCFTWALYTLAAAGPMARSGPLRVTTFAMGVAALLVAAATAGMGARVEAMTARVAAALVFLGVVCSGVAYWLWFSATHDEGPTRTASLLYVEPFVTLVTARVLCDESITANAVGGGIIVLVGVWLVRRGAAHAHLAGGQSSR